MPNQLRAYKIEKKGKVVTFITHKMTYKDDPDDYTYSIYAFEKLTTKEMLGFVEKLNEYNIPYKNYPKKGKWEIQIKETEINSFHVGEPEYKQCTKKQLIMLLNQKNMEMQNIKFQSDNLHKAYSKLYHLYKDSQNNNSK